MLKNPKMDTVPVCFLAINTPPELASISIGSCLSVTQNEIYIGYINLSEVASFQDNPRVQLVDLSQESQQFAISKSGYTDFSQKEFFQLVQLKWELISKVLAISSARFIQYCDLDVIWISDPSSTIVDTFENESRINLLIQDFTTNPSLPNLCMGYCAFKNDATTTLLITKLKKIHGDLLAGDPYLGDDDVVTYYYRNNRYGEIERLPQITFPVGNMGLLYSKKTYYPGIKAPNPYIFHANFVLGTRRKIEYLEMISRSYRIRISGKKKVAPIHFRLTRLLRTIKFSLQL
jgi:hypothetical protein